MSERAELNLPPKLAKFLKRIQDESSPEEAATIFEDMGDILEDLVVKSYAFKCDPADFYEELITTYGDIERIALKGHALLEVGDNGQGTLAGFGEPIMPPMLESTLVAAQKRNHLRLIVANPQKPEPEPAS